MVFVAAIQRIVIDQKRAELGVKVTRAQMHISTPKPKMKITYEDPEMIIERQAPTFRVNRRKINAETGLKSPMELTYDFRNDGREGAFNAAKVAVEDGNFLGNVKDSGDRVARLAQNKAMASILKKRQVNVGLMPKEKAEIQWDKGYMRVNWTKHSISIDCEGEYMPQMTVDPPYSIEVYLRTKPYFRIVVQEAEDPNKPGSRVNEEI
ncbi:MAG: DUF6470 family protein [Oscillospiraceae bacterium]|nr:DUF6470 family protein [Oscillospiraceae bacterium]